jgi:hypothetical protein
MTQDDQDLLDLLTFELKFLEDGGYGRSPHTPWRRQRVFEDSITCPNFGDPARPHLCSECLLMRFVPSEFRDQDSPCRLIPLTPKGETIDYFYRCGTQMELEEALAGWLRQEISSLQEPHKAERNPNGLDEIRRRQWLVFAENLYFLANFHRENENYPVAHALYGRALAVAEKVSAPGDSERALVARIQRDRQEVSETMPGTAGNVHKAPIAGGEKPVVVLQSQESIER